MFKYDREQFPEDVPNGEDNDDDDEDAEPHPHRP